jgi:glyoxylase-like metal-dependent hydrolase (beta-lactamase superfamily II)
MSGPNDAVDWRTDLGVGTSVALVQAGTFRSDAGTLFGPVPWVLWGDLVADEVDDKRRLLQALNCLLIETPSGRVLVETGIGERVDEKTRAMRSYEGPWVVDALERAGFLPESVNVVAMSHLHFDHAGGLLRADGERAFPHATIVAQKAEWEVALGDNPRLVASYVQPELRLVADWGAQGWADGERELLPGVSVIPTGGHSTGHQAIVVRGSGKGARTLAFFGDLFMRPWGANPRWVTAFDDFPLDSVIRKAELFAQAADEDWLIALSHEARHPVGHLVRDRDRFRYEPV